MYRLSLNVRAGLVLYVLTTSKHYMRDGLVLYVQYSIRLDMSEQYNQLDPKVES